MILPTLVFPALTLEVKVELALVVLKGHSSPQQKIILD
jgi:hypothetical protein